MAEIAPFRAWRYNQELGNIKEFVSPLFDVVDKHQLALLYKNPYNSIHLSVPEESSTIDQLIGEWKTNKIIVQDPLPCIYVYYQYYQSENESEIKCRKGFICSIRIHEWDEKIILRHESIIPHSVNDRIQVLEKSKMNISPTHGLYTDENLTLEPYMDECINSPLYEFTDYQGVTNKLGIIQDLKVIERFFEVLRDKQIILADGHHRYTASLELRRKLKTNTSEGNTIPEDFQSMYLTNTENNDLTIYPTHRLIKDIPEFNIEEVINKLNVYFLVEQVDNPTTIIDMIAKTPHSFGVVFKDKSIVIRLRNHFMEELNWNFPWEIKNLDLTILHFFIIEKILRIKGKDQKNWKNVNFSSNLTNAVLEVENESIQMAVITRNISIEEIKKVCYSGYTFPYKSTFFYPKVLCGLLFHSIENDHFLKEKYFKK